MFEFKEFNDLTDGEIKLAARNHDQPDYDAGVLPRYAFSIIHIGDNKDIGVVYFAVDTTRRQYMRGHLSYAVSPNYRGHGYAAKACKLIKKVALAHGFARLYIGSGADNTASRKTIEKLGTSPITIDDIPDYKILAYLHEESIDMYVWILADDGQEHTCLETKA